MSGVRWLRTGLIWRGVPPFADLDLPPVELGEDIDDVAIRRRMAGDRSVRLSVPEAMELVRRWKASGQPLNECRRITGLEPTRYHPNRREAS